MYMSKPMHCGQNDSRLYAGLVTLIEQINSYENGLKPC